MNDAWFFAILSVLLVSLISLIGVITFAINSKFLNKILLLLVSFSTGSLFGAAFLHLIPEALEQIESPITVSLFILGGILVFFILEKFVKWRHCHVYGICSVHDEHKNPSSFAIMNLIGDGFHNFLDGLIIGASYMIDVYLGFSTTIAIILHEIPQEISDFGVLVHGGYKRTKALLLNFSVALASILGVIISLVFGSNITGFSIVLLPIAAGGFIYIAGSDLIPELHKEFDTKKSLLQFLSLIAGIGLMLILV